MHFRRRSASTSGGKLLPAVAYRGHAGIALLQFVELWVWEASSCQRLPNWFAGNASLHLSFCDSGRCNLWRGRSHQEALCRKCGRYGRDGERGRVGAQACQYPIAVWDLGVDALRLSAMPASAPVMPLSMSFCPHEPCGAYQRCRCGEWLGFSILAVR